MTRCTALKRLNKKAMWTTLKTLNDFMDYPKNTE